MQDGQQIMYCSYMGQMPWNALPQVVFFVLNYIIVDCTANYNYNYHYFSA